MTAAGADLRLVELDAASASAFGEMTFPIYRRLLHLAPTVRHPEWGDARRVRPLALAALRGGAAVGLALAELPLDDLKWAELLSLYVVPEERGRGVGTALVAAVEGALASRRVEELRVVYTEGKPGIVALERALESRGWATPSARTVSVRFDPRRTLESDLFSPRRMEALSKGLEIVPWREIPEAEKNAARASHERTAWITPPLAFWRFETAAFDPLSSVGARFRGMLVGWAINHRVSATIVRCAASFMRKDLSRRSRIVPLYWQSMRLLAATEIQRCTFVTPVGYPNMIHFIDRWIRPIAEFVGETKGSHKALARSAPDEG